MYGAGNIGRGFIGQVLHDSGYEVVFIDVNTAVLDQLNKNHSYPHRIVSESLTEERLIDNVRGVNGNDLEAVAQEIAECEVMATSVGANILKFVAPNVAAGIKKRAALNGRPLNILLCENLMDAAKFFRGLLELYFEGDEKALLDNVGLVETSIGRMVPALSPEMQEGDCTRIFVEPYCELPVDAKAFVGPIPALKYIVPFTPFRFYEERKLYIHNMGHAITAYFGYLKGYTYIWEAIADPKIRELAAASMNNTAQALSKGYGVEPAVLRDHVEDLLSRFTNKKLGDTVKRVGQDPLRKLKPSDRFIGAIGRCKQEGIGYDGILRGVAACLHFDNEADKSAVELQAQLKEKGTASFLQEYCGLSAEDAARCAGYYDEIRELL